MVTYEDLFTFVIMICAIVTLVKQHKKWRPYLGGRTLFFISIK